MVTTKTVNLHLIYSSTLPQTVVLYFPVSVNGIIIFLAWEVESSYSDHGFGITKSSGPALTSAI